jgi:membrane protein
MRMKRLKEAKQVVAFILRDMERKHLQVVAAGVAYYFMISLFPALVLLTAVVAFLPLQNAMHGATSFMGHIMPPQGVSLMEQGLATITPHRTGLLTFGIVTTLWLCSKGMLGVIGGLDIAHNVREPRRIWTNRILAFGLTFAVGIMLVLGVLLTLIGPVLEGLLSAATPVQSLWIRLWPYFQWSLSAIFTFAAIELLYLLGPNVPLAHRMTIPGAIIAAATWLVLTWGLGFYFHHFGNLKLNNVYGVLATPIALMMWLSWGAKAILVGAEINVGLQLHKQLRSSTPEEVLQRRTDAA